VGEFQRNTRKGLDSVNSQISALAPHVQTAESALAEARRQGNVASGSERLREVEASLPWYSRMMRDWSEPIAYTAGPIIRGITRAGIVRHANRVSADAARAAENLIGSPATPLSDRVGRLAGQERALQPTPAPILV
jgi:hypothetical protein